MNGSLDNFSSYGRDVLLGIKELPRLTLSKLWKVFSLMGKRERIALGLLAIVALASLSVSAADFYYGHTTAVPSQGGVYTEGMLGQPQYINPLLANMEPDLSLTNLVFSGLYKYDNNGHLVPDLADGMPQISADQKQYTINLKTNAQWHNGQPVTADDVVFTIQTLQDPNFKSPLRALWSSTTVTKISDYSVMFTTREVSAPFLSSLTLPILPKNIWGETSGQDFLLSKNNLEAIGSGPYAIKEIKKLPSGSVEQITLNSFANYYGGRPKIDGVVVKFYDTEQDLLNAFHSREILGFGFTPLTSGIQLDKSQPNTQIITLPLPQYQVVFFNLNNSFLADQNVREALNLATDKQAVINTVFNGNALLPASPLLFQDQQNSAPISNTVDLVKAGALLDSSGWTVDPKTGLRENKKGTALSLTVTTNDSLTNSTAAQTLVDQWRKLNITVNLNIVPGKQITDSVIRPRAFDVLLFPQKFSADPDPFLFWHSSQVKDPGYNLTGFANATADKLILDARGTTNRAQRESDYAQFNALVSQQVPVIFLDQTEYVYAIDSGVRNIGLKVLYDPSQRFYDLPNWYMSTSRVWK